MNIPEFSLNQWRTRPTQTLADELCLQCHQVGFFLLTEHGVHQQLLDDVFRLSTTFFDQPLTKRQQIDKTLSRHFRGWEAEGSEYTNGRPDIRQQVDLWTEHPALTAAVEPAYLRLLGPNQWPHAPGLADFKATMNQWFQAMGTVADELMGVLAQGLGLPGDYFEQLFGEQRMSLTKLIRYPATPAGQHGVNAHHDAGFMTLLAPGVTPGLQIETASGSWVDVPIVPGALVVNLGEILQSITGNYLLATPHRVITQGQRQSAGYFHGPSLNMPLAPIKLAPRFAQAVATSPRHRNAGFMAPQEETLAGISDMTSHYQPGTYGEQLWNYFCRSYPANVSMHYGADSLNTAGLGAPSSGFGNPAIISG